VPVISATTNSRTEGYFRLEWKLAMGQTYLAEPDAGGEEARTLRPLQAAAITYRIAFGPRAGQKVLTLRGAMLREGTARQPLCADIDGFSLHAAVRVEAHDRKRLEQLCRYITGAALSDERVQLNAAVQVELKLKTPWRDGTTHLVMSPLKLMRRLAALVPRPRLHQPTDCFTAVDLGGPMPALGRSEPVGRPASGRGPLCYQVPRPEFGHVRTARPRPACTARPRAGTSATPSCVTPAESSNTDGDGWH
jgi:hypothetical protein